LLRPGSYRRAAAVFAVVAVGMVGGAVLVSSGAAAAAGSDFTLTGSVDGLYPGRTMDLAVVVQNVQPFRLTVNTADVGVGDASSACHASNLVAQGFAGAVVVAPNRTATVPVKLQLLDTAPDSCQAASFPLTFHATGLLDAPTRRPTGHAGMLAFTGLGWAASAMAVGGLVLLIVGLGILNAADPGRERRTVR
jgi:hypothetical protein